MRFLEHDTVKLVRNITEKGLTKGTIGVIVAVYSIPNEAYEVEFVDDFGITIVQTTFLPDELEKVE